MKIAIVNDVLGSGSNGTFVATDNLVNHLRACGHSVRIICADQTKRGVKDYYVTPVKKFGRALDGYVKRAGVSLAKCSKKLWTTRLKA